jgi:hypothetical protein
MDAYGPGPGALFCHFSGVMGVRRQCSDSEQGPAAEEDPKNTELDDRRRQTKVAPALRQPYRLAVPGVAGTSITV